MLKQKLQELCDIKVLTSSLSIQIRSCQEKLIKMLEMLPCLFSSKSAMEEALKSLQTSIRAKKHRKFKNMTAVDYTIHASNSLGLSWSEVVDKIVEAETGSEGHYFNPLTSEQLKNFVNIQDHCYQMNYCGIPGKRVLCEEYRIQEALLKVAIQQESIL